MSIELETETRKLLAAAIVMRDAAADQVTSSSAALARAVGMVAALENEIQRNKAYLQNQEEQTAAALAEQLRQGDAALTIASVPKVSAEDCKTAQTRISVATAARDQIQCETESLQRTLIQAEGLVRQHALALVRIEAERLAIAIEQHEAELLRLGTLLRGVDLATYLLAAAPDGTWQRPTLLSPRAMDALQRQEEPQLRGGHDTAKDTAERWKQFYVALTKGESRAAFA
jgi:hypothetical protein